MARNIAVFLDRDGTINEEVGYLDSLDKLKLIPSAYEAIGLINASGMKAVVVTNQSGVARGVFTEQFVNLTNETLQKSLRQRGSSIDKFYYCPHHPNGGFEPYRRNCECRKPSPGMLLQAASELNIDLNVSYMIGDTYRDMEAAKNAGVKGILVKTGYGLDMLQDSSSDSIPGKMKYDCIAEDILDAVKWIMKDKEKGIK